MNGIELKLMGAKNDQPSPVIVQAGAAMSTGDMIAKPRIFVKRFIFAVSVFALLVLTLSTVQANQHQPPSITRLDRLARSAIRSADNKSRSASN
jgi:hypothetical protein